MDAQGMNILKIAARIAGAHCAAAGFIEMWADPDEAGEMDAYALNRAIEAIKGALEAVGANVDLGSDRIYIAFDETTRGRVQRIIDAILGGSAGPDAAKFFGMFH